MKNELITNSQIVVGEKLYKYPEHLPLPQIGTTVNYAGYAGMYKGTVVDIEININQAYYKTSTLIRIILKPC